MLRIIGERGSGKTRAIIGVANAFGAIIIVPDRGIANIYQDELGEDRICASSDLESLIQRKRGKIKNRLNVVFDELDFSYFKSIKDHIWNLYSINLVLVAYGFTLDEDYELQVFRKL